MKNGEKPTLKQIKIMRNNKIDPSLYLVSKVFPDHLECVPKKAGDAVKAYYKVAVI